MRKTLLFLLLACSCTATWKQFRIEPCENPVAGVSQAERSFYAALVSLHAKQYEITDADPSNYTIDASLERTKWSGAEIRKRHYKVDWLLGVEPDGTVTMDVEAKKMPKRQFNVYLGWARKIAAIFRTNRCRALDVLRGEVEQYGLIPEARPASRADPARAPSTSGR